MDKHKSEDVTRRLVRFRNISVLLAWLVMPLPFFVYFTRHTGLFLDYSPVYRPSTADLLWIMILANLLAYVAVSLWTIQIAKQTLFTDKLKASISVRFANRPVIARWWSAVQQTWKWNVVAAIPRIGLVLGLVQLFHLDVFSECRTLNLAKFLFQPYCYASHSDGSGIRGFANPQVITFLIGLIVIVLFALSNAGLLSAIAHLKFSVKPSTRLIHIFLARQKVALIFLAFVFVFELGLVLVTDPFPKPSSSAPYGYNWEWKRIFTYWGYNQPRLISISLLNSSEIVLWALVDNGTMLATNIMRPVGEGTTFGKYMYSEEAPNPQNLQFVLSQLLLACISLSLMALQTYRYLRRMERLDIGHTHGQA